MLLVIICQTISAAMCQILAIYCIFVVWYYMKCGFIYICTQQFIKCMDKRLILRFAYKVIIPDVLETNTVERL